MNVLAHEPNSKSAQTCTITQGCKIRCRERTLQPSKRGGGGGGGGHNVYCTIKFCHQLKKKIKSVFSARCKTFIQFHLACASLQTTISLARTNNVTAVSTFYIGSGTSKCNQLSRKNVGAVLIQYYDTDQSIITEKEASNKY